MLVLIGIYYHYEPPGFKLFAKSAALTLITVLITILVGKVVRLKMMTF
jgi:hypothetical protein